ETAPHVSIGDGMVQAYIIGPGGSAIPTVSIGGTNDAFRIIDSSGNFLGGIKPDATITTPALDADVIRLEGQDLQETMDDLPHGQLMYADEYVGPVEFTTKTGVYEFTIPVKAGRTYAIFANWRGRSTDRTYY